MKLAIKSRFGGAVLFEAEVDASLPYGLQIGAAVKLALKARAYLARADLAGADLTGANLAGANLAGANLAGANLAGAKNAATAIAMTRILPAGSIIGWKKCEGGVIVKLRIPEEAKRSHAFGRKCRAEYAEVLEVIGARTARSQHDPGFIYEAGQTVRPGSWDDDWTNECSGGVHFYITRAEAENH